MKEQYLFVLGRDPELSKIEIESVLEILDINYEIIDSSKSVIILNMDKQLNKDIIKKLGGTIKIGKIISNSSRLEDIQEILEKTEFYQGNQNKVYYSVEGYNTNLTDYIQGYLKDYFKQQKIKAILKKEMAPKKMIKKEMTEKGVELIIHKSFIARTILVSNPLEIKERDIRRPNVDYMKTISIRLAKILINFSKTKQGQTLIDPFCGSGTILQEALLQEINVIGLDNDQESIKQSKENIEWLKKNYEIKAQHQLYKLDSRKMSSVITKADSLVTEPYMGPYIRKLPTINEARELATELTNLYTTTIKQATQILKKGGRIVIVIPRIRTRDNKKVIIDLNPVIEQTGLIRSYNPILYAYKESKLHREIWVLEKP